MLRRFTAFQIPIQGMATAIGNTAVAMANTAEQFVEISKQTLAAYNAMDAMMTKVALKILEEERRKNQEIDWDIANRVMEPALSELESAGFCKNIRMDALYETGALGEKVCIGYKVSAFNGRETRMKTVLFPSELGDSE